MLVCLICYVPSLPCSDKVTKTRRWFLETALELDQEYSVRRRIRSAVDDVQRMLPTWRRQVTEFSNTQFGKASLTLLLVGLLLSGVLWQLLNVVWLLWWGSTPLACSWPISAAKLQGQQQAAAAAAAVAAVPSAVEAGRLEPAAAGVLMVAVAIVTVVTAVAAVVVAEVTQVRALLWMQNGHGRH